MNIQIITRKCTGCGLCVKACSFGAIRIIDKKAVIDLERCNLCGACVPACKLEAILLDKAEVRPQKLNRADYKDVWVFAEQKKAEAQPVVFELLAKAKQLAKSLDTQVAAVLLGNDLSKEAEKLIWYGADKVYLI